MSMRTMIEAATRQVTEVTGLKAATVTGAYNDDEGCHVVLEMVEMARIPSAQDVLGEYEVLLDGRGGILKMERRRCRLRGATGG